MGKMILDPGYSVYWSTQAKAPIMTKDQPGFMAIAAQVLDGYGSTIEKNTLTRRKENEWIFGRMV
jgi:hypothetical protein